MNTPQSPPQLRHTCPVCARSGADDETGINSPTLFLHQVLHRHERAGPDSLLYPLTNTPTNLLPLWSDILWAVSVKTMEYVSSMRMGGHPCLAGTCGHKSGDECGEAIVEELWLELTRVKETTQTADADPAG